MAEVLSCLNELRAQRTDEGRLFCARRLREVVRNDASRATDMAFAHSFGLLNARFAELLSSNSVIDRISAVWAVYELTDLSLPWGEEQKIARFSAMLSSALPAASDPYLLRLIVRAMGHLTRVGGSITADFAESEMLRALSWLGAVEPPRNEARKLACVLLLRELMEGAHTLFFPHAPIFFAHIWSALSDARVQIREAAARALCTALALLSSRRSRARVQWCAAMYNTARAALASGGGVGSIQSASGVGARWCDVVHGALLVIGELLATASEGGSSKDGAQKGTSSSRAAAAAAATASYGRGQNAASSSAAAFASSSSFPLHFMHTHYGEICEMVLKYRNSRDKLIRHTVISLLPSLAQLLPDSFVRFSWAEISLNHLLTVLESPHKRLGGEALDGNDLTSISAGGDPSSDPVPPSNASSNAVHISGTLPPGSSTLGRVSSLGVSVVSGLPSSSILPPTNSTPSSSLPNSSPNTSTSKTGGLNSSLGSASPPFGLDSLPFERSIAFTTFGKIALAISHHLASPSLSSQLERLVGCIRESLIGECVCVCVCVCMCVCSRFFFPFWSDHTMWSVRHNLASSETHTLPLPPPLYNYSWSWHSWFGNQPSGSSSECAE